jgi:transcriptional regulator with XRE-family HTH domain
MTLCEATAIRIEKLLTEKNMKLYHLEKRSGILHGTMACIMRRKNKDITLGKIMMIAKGFDMSFIEFLDDPIFHSEELEYEY